jgi:hypothetical protein
MKIHLLIANCAATRARNLPHIVNCRTSTDLRKEILDGLLQHTAALSELLNDREVVGTGNDNGCT